MIEDKAKSLYDAIKEAVLEAIEVVGIEGVREMSMFPSSKYNQTNDNALETLRIAA